MGAEALCTAHFAGKRSEGKALLETEHLIFRGDFRLAIPRASITHVDAASGRLHVTFPDGTAVFDLGPAAAKWADKIRNPRSLLDKLGIKPASRVAVLGVNDEAFLAQLAERTSAVVRGRVKKHTDVIVYGVTTPRDLARLETLRASLEPNGAIWVVHEKGKGAALRDVDVFAAAKRAGLVDNKVASFSPTHTAEKLVIPLMQRKPRPRRGG